MLKLEKEKCTNCFFFFTSKAKNDASHENPQKTCKKKVGSKTYIAHKKENKKKSQMGNHYAKDKTQEAG